MDNTEDNTNHTFSVLRDPEIDLLEDLLMDHLFEEHAAAYIKDTYAWLLSRLLYL